MIRTIEKINNALVSIEYWVCVPLFVLMLGLMLAQVLCRYFLQIPLSFSEELARIVFVCCTFIGAAIATGERGHIEINFMELAIGRFLKSQKGKLRAAMCMNVLRDAGTIVCLAIVSYQTYLLVVDQFQMGQVSTAMSMPLWIVTGAMFLGLVLAIVHSALLIVLNLSGCGPMGYEFAKKGDS